LLTRLAVTAAIFVLTSAPVLATTTCADLHTAQIPNTTLTAESISADTGIYALAGLHGTLCKVDAVVKPTPDSFIRVELFLPDPSVWNGKFLGTGNGSLAGHIALRFMLEGALQNYAVANTDMGTNPAGAKGAVDWHFGKDHPERIVDFAYRATHEMTVVSKAIIAAYYGKPPAESYFHGCSTGGRQALTEAERYPLDYNGIIAGDPVSNLTHLYMTALSDYIQFHKGPDSNITPAIADLLQSAAIKACPAQLDPGGKFLIDPLACHFDPATLACNPGESKGCLTPGQVASSQAIFDGVHNARTGALIWPGFEPGVHLTHEDRFNLPLEKNGDPPIDAAQTLNWSTHWHGPIFDFDKDVATVDADLGFLNADNPDLKAFRKAGGKLILYTGWADSVIAPQGTISFYESVEKKMGGPAGTSSFARFFVIPGMGHCFRGPGPYNVDTLTPLDQWVRTGKAPAELVGNNPESSITRPICPFPSMATYDGHGPVNEVASYACKVPPR
jgi:hypothetical protein